MRRAELLDCARQGATHDDSQRWRIPGRQRNSARVRSWSPKRGFRQSHFGKSAHGNAVVEFLLVPLVLLPLVFVIVRAAGIERAQLQITSAGRDLQRAMALVPDISNLQIRAIAMQILADNDIAQRSVVDVRETRNGLLVNLQTHVTGLIPATEKVISVAVDLSP